MADHSNDSPSARELGNTLFREQQFLKAAAVYTKAIKESPDDAVLYRCVVASTYQHTVLPRHSSHPLQHSNRCAALMKISKFSKALDDAATVIRLRPDWDKGYYRKASVLEAMDKQEDVWLSRGNRRR